MKGQDEMVNGDSSMGKRRGRRGRAYHSHNHGLELEARGSMDSMETEECWGRWGKEA